MPRAARFGATRHQAARFATVERSQGVTAIVTVTIATRFAPSMRTPCDTYRYMRQTTEVTLIDCIYCCKQGVPSAEHVTQKALGGNLTIEDVCKACNGSLSTID